MVKYLRAFIESSGVVSWRLTTCSRARGVPRALHGILCHTRHQEANIRGCAGGNPDVWNRHMVADKGSLDKLRVVEKDFWRRCVRTRRAGIEKRTEGSCEKRGGPGDAGRTCWWRMWLAGISVQTTACTEGSGGTLWRQYRENPGATLVGPIGWGTCG